METIQSKSPDELMSENMGLVLACYVREFRRKVPSNHRLYDDLLGAMRLAYCRAASQWEDGIGSKFATYAWVAMKHAGMDYLASEFKSGLFGVSPEDCPHTLPESAVNTGREGVALFELTPGDDEETAPLEDSEVIAFARRLVNSIMDDKTRAMAHMMLIQGKSSREVACALGTCHKTVLSTVQVAVRRFKLAASEGRLKDPQGDIR